jgi:hypothetical protein
MRDNQQYPISALPWKILLALCVLATILAYSPGLDGPFIFDDRANILANPTLHVESLNIQEFKAAALSSNSGPLKRPVSMFSFALNHYFTGLDPAPFKITNLALHLINGILIFFLIRLLLRQISPRTTVGQANSNRHIQLVAIAVTAAWLLHPLALTSILYIVQRMTTLATLFILAGLLLYAIGRSRMLTRRSWTIYILATICICLPLAVLSKENGILLPLYLFVTELAFFRFRTLTPYGKKALVGFFTIFLFAPSVVITIYLIANPEWLLERYAARDFSPLERLLTETRAVWFYLGLILLPENSRLGLFHDDFTVSRSLLDPASTSFTLLGIVCALIALPYVLRHTPILAFGIMFYLAGHALESTILPLELVHEHRNYLGMLGIIFPVFYYLLHPAISSKTIKTRKILAITMIAILGGITSIRASYWSDYGTLAMYEAANHPDSPRANAILGEVFATQALIAGHEKKDIFYQNAKKRYLQSTELQDNYANGLIEIIKLSQQLEYPTENTWLDELERRLRHEPFLTNTAIGLDTLIACQKTGGCQLTKERMTQLIQASLGNQTLKGRIRSETLTMASKYYIEQAGDPASALYLIAQAATTQPKDPRYRLHLVTLLTILGRHEDAREELDKAIALDRLGAYRSEIKTHLDRLSP